MFEHIEQYIQRPQEQRASHLDLKLKCIEIGGYSKEFRGMLAHFLKTTIPENMRGKVCLCHACNNSKCSNVKHMYWGTYRENMEDAKKCGALLESYPNPNRYIPTLEERRRGGKKAFEKKVGIFAGIS